MRLKSLLTKSKHVESANVDLSDMLTAALEDYSDLLFPPPEDLPDIEDEEVECLMEHTALLRPHRRLAQTRPWKKVFFGVALAASLTAFFGGAWFFLLSKQAETVFSVAMVFPVERDSQGFIFRGDATVKAVDDIAEIKTGLQRSLGLDDSYFFDVRETGSERDLSQLLGQLPRLRRTGKVLFVRLDESGEFLLISLVDGETGSEINSEQLSIRDRSVHPRLREIIETQLQHKGD